MKNLMEIDENTNEIHELQLESKEIHDIHLNS
jgi:hypothetical protein